MSNAALHDRATGALLGAFIGDALALGFGGRSDRFRVGQGQGQLDRFCCVS